MEVYHLDVRKAVQRFQTQFEGLFRLPFISDDEMKQLFGEEVYSGLEGLRSLELQKKYCRDCKSRCCYLVDCEFYSESLTSCPVHSFRPVLCRMHFCNSFASESPLVVKELGDIFLDSWIAAQQIDADKARLLDSPPLSQYAPEIVSSIAARIKEIVADKQVESRVLSLIQTEIEKYRTNQVEQK
jgi:Fe-S-cluster containining protein